MFPRLIRFYAALIAGLALTSAPALAESTPQARLVHCGGDTCLRLSGHRPQATVTIAIAGHALAVAGGRNWHATVPLAIARAWGTPAGDVLTLALGDTRADSERLESVALPPGALGRRVELATLVVRAR